MKKLINLLILLTLSTSGYTAQWTGIFEGSYPLLTGKKYDSCEQFVTAYNKAYQPAQYGNQPWNGNTLGKLTYSHTEFIASNPYYPARFRCYATTYSGSSASFLFTADDSGENACKKGVVSTAYFERVPSVTVCLGTEYGNLAGCEANLQHVEVLKTKHLGKYGAYGKFSTTGKQCNFSTNPKDTGNGYTVPPKNVCDNKSFCEVSSPSNCPNGYGSGTFNGKTYCVLKTPNSPNPPTSPPSDSGDTGSSGSTDSSSGSTDSSSGSTDGSSGSTGGSSGSTGGSSGSTGGSSGSTDGSSGSTDGSSGSTGGGSGSGDTGSGNEDGFLKSIWDWLTKSDPLPDAEKTTVTDITSKRTISTDLYGSNAQCIPPRQLNIAGYGVNYTFSFQPICDGLHMLSFIIMALAYVYGAYIISKS